MGVDRLMFPRPMEEFLTVERTPVPGICPRCGEERLARYPVANSMGPRIAVKCQGCLHIVSCERPGPEDHWPPWASATQGWPSSRAG